MLVVGDNFIVNSQLLYIRTDRLLHRQCKNKLSSSLKRTCLTYTIGKINSSIPISRPMAQGVLKIRMTGTQHSQYIQHM